MKADTNTHQCSLTHLPRDASSSFAAVIDRTLFDRRKEKGKISCKTMVVNLSSLLRRDSSSEPPSHYLEEERGVYVLFCCKRELPRLSFLSFSNVFMTGASEEVVSSSSASCESLCVCLPSPPKTLRIVQVTADTKKRKGNQETTSLLAYIFWALY